MFPPSNHRVQESSRPHSSISSSNSRGAIYQVLDLPGSAPGPIDQHGGDAAPPLRLDAVFNPRCRIRVLSVHNSLVCVGYLHSAHDLF